MTRRTCVGRVTSLLSNTQPRFGIAFLPRSERPADFMAAVTVHSEFRDKKRKSATASSFPLLFAVK